MTTQPEALRLADALDDEFVQGRISNHTGRKAAAELRRLSEIETLYLAAMRGRHAMSEELLAVTAQRDALLEALKTADQFITNGMELGFIRMPDAATPDSAHETPGIVRAAIKAVEGEKA